MIRRRTTLVLAVLAVLGLTSCDDRTPTAPFGFGPRPLPPPIPPTPVSPGGPADSLLDAYRGLWVSAGIETYRYRFQWLCFCTEDYVRVVDITVSKGAVVSVVDASTGRPVSPRSAAYYRTIDGLFDFLRDAIDRPAYSFRAAYDASLGYPADSYVDYVEQLADEEMGFRVYGLSPIRLQSLSFTSATASRTCRR